MCHNSCNWPLPSDVSIKVEGKKKTENSQLEKAMTNDEIVNFIISILTLPAPHLRLSFRMIGYDLDQIDTTVEKNMLLMSTKMTHPRSCLKLVHKLDFEIDLKK